MLEVVLSIFTWAAARLLHDRIRDNLSGTAAQEKLIVYNQQSKSLIIMTHLKDGMLKNDNTLVQTCKYVKNMVKIFYLAYVLKLLKVILK